MVIKDNQIKIIIIKIKIKINIRIHKSLIIRLINWIKRIKRIRILNFRLISRNKDSRKHMLLRVSIYSQRINNSSQIINSRLCRKNSNILIWTLTRLIWIQLIWIQLIWIQLIWIQLIWIQMAWTLSILIAVYLNSYNNNNLHSVTSISSKMRMSLINLRRTLIWIWMMMSWLIKICKILIPPHRGVLYKITIISKVQH